MDKKASKKRKNLSFPEMFEDAPTANKFYNTYSNSSSNSKHSDG